MLEQQAPLIRKYTQVLPRFYEITKCDEDEVERDHCLVISPFLQSLSPRVVELDSIWQIVLNRQSCANMQEEAYVTCRGGVLAIQ